MELILNRYPDLKNIIIIDPSCVGDSRTHQFSALRGHAHAFLNAGYRVYAGTNLHCNAKFDELINFPVFPYTIYDDVRSGTTSRLNRLLKLPYYSYLARDSSQAVLEILKDAGCEPSDHLFIPTCDTIILRSVTKLVKAGKLPQSLHILLMYEKANWMTGGYPYKRIINTLKWLLSRRNNIHIYTETKRHASGLEKALGFRPEHFPYPAMEIDNSRNYINDTDQIYIGALGGGRKDKGYHLLPEIIRKFNNIYLNKDKVVFLIQRVRPEDNLDDITRELNSINNVEILENQLGRDEYTNTMMKCDIALFPYGYGYTTRGSGIVNEAVVNGIPIVCTRNTALTEAITSDNGLTASTAEEFAQSLQRIILNIDIYKDNASVAKYEFIKELYNNPVIQNIRRGESPVINDP